MKGIDKIIQAVFGGLSVLNGQFYQVSAPKLASGESFDAPHPAVLQPPRKRRPAFGVVLKILFLLFSILLPAAKTLTASVGAEAAPFLKIDAGARAAALGGAFTAIADDASSIFYNPAGAGLMKNAELFLSHNQWIEELNTEHISYVHPVSEKLACFAGFSTLFSPAMNSYDSGGNKTGSFNAVDRMFGLGASSTGKNIIRAFFIKVITQEAYDEKGMAFAGDLGLMKNDEDSRFGLSIQNLGTKMKMHDEEFKLPLTYKAGWAYRFMHKYWFAGEVAGGEAVSVAFGAEGEFDLSRSAKGYIRCGYNSGRSENTGSGISAGLGFKALKFALDYAFSPFGDFGSVHRITFGLRFGENRDGVSAVKYNSSEFRSKPVETYQEPEIEQSAYASSPKAAQTALAASEPGTYDAYMEYAEDYLSQRDYENAFIQYGNASKSISVDDERQVYILERQGLTLIKRKNCKRAKRFYAAAIRIAKKLKVADKNVVNAYSGLAYCQEKSGNTDWAATNYKKALKLTDDANLKTKILKRLEKLAE